MASDPFLTYVENETSCKPNAVICQVYAFKIQFHGDGKTMGRTYSLGTQTMEDLEQWMKLVRSKKTKGIKLQIL